MRKGLGAWLFVGMLALPGCGIEPDRVFERNAPQVDRAIEALDAGEAGPAAELLQAYLGTGKCEKGEIGVTDLARSRTSASFDLGLALFLLGEKFGARFGEEELSLRDGGPTDEQKQQMDLRGEQVTCALKILRAIGSSQDLPVDLAARARYLEGNLEFLRRNYRDAVRAYDDALRLVPGVASDAGDEVGRDAAWNRAIALRRIEENERDAGQDAQEDQDASQDTSPDTDSGSPEGGEDAPQESGDEGQQDAPSEDSGGGDGAPDGGDGSAPEDENKQPDAGAPDGGKQPPPEPQTQDERILDMLEAAPTVQLEDARRHAARRQTRGMVDK